VDDRLAAGGGNLDRGMGFAGGGAADQQRQWQSLALQLARHVHHFIERRRDQPAQTDDVDVLLARRGQDLSQGVMTPRSMTS